MSVIVVGIPFREFASQNSIAENTDDYRELEQLYEQIQSTKELIQQAYQFRPIGPETARLYFGKFQSLGIEDAGKERLLSNVQEIQAIVEAHIEKAKAKEAALLREFRSKLSERNSR